MKQTHTIFFFIIIIQEHPEYEPHSMREFGLNSTNEDMNEIYYRILDTHGDMAYAQAIDPPVTLLTIDGQTLQQVLSSCVDVPVATTTEDCQTTTRLQHLVHSPLSTATLPTTSQLQLTPTDNVITVPPGSSTGSSTTQR